MEENKNLKELRNELEQAKREKLQAEHQLQRKKNQLSYRESTSRKERSHRLIICGAIFEKYFPVIKDLSEKELSEALSKVDVAAFAKELEVAIESSILVEPIDSELSPCIVLLSFVLLVVLHLHLAKLRDVTCVGR